MGQGQQNPTNNYAMCLTKQMLRDLVYVCDNTSFNMMWQNLAEIFNLQFHCKIDVKIWSHAIFQRSCLHNLPEKASIKVFPQKASQTPTTWIKSHDSGCKSKINKLSETNNWKHSTLQPFFQKRFPPLSKYLLTWKLHCVLQQPWSNFHPNKEIYTVEHVYGK